MTNFKVLLHLINNLFIRNLISRISVLEVQIRNQAFVCVWSLIKILKL